MTTASPEQVLQNNHRDAGATTNHLNLDLGPPTSIYLSMSYYFDYDDMALKNFAKYFLHQSQESEHAEKLMNL